MFTYKDLLSKLNIPSEEEFNDLIKNLPPFDNLDEDFEYDFKYDDLAELLFSFGVLRFFPCWIKEFDLENKTVEIQDISSLEELNKINDLLTSSGWTLSNYEEDKAFFGEEKTRTMIEIEKQQLLSKIKDASMEQLREFAKNVD